MFLYKTFDGIKEVNLGIITALVGIVVINQGMKEVVVEVPDWFVHHPCDEPFTVLQTTLILNSDLSHTVQAFRAADFHLKRTKFSVQNKNDFKLKPFLERKILN